MKKKITIAFLAGVLGVLLPINLYMSSLLPPNEGNLDLPGLKSNVKVVKDRWGVPHIYADNEEDAHRALGYVMAGDRLFQMDMLRRIANGELSEVLGDKAVQFDILLRKLRLRATMDEYWEKNRDKLDTKMLTLMTAFVEGIHHYVDTQPLPIEFKLLGYKPAKFTIPEGMAISGYLALSFAEGLIADPLFSDLLSNFPGEQVEELRIRHARDNNDATKQINLAYTVTQNWYGNMLETIEFLEQYLGLFHGSNSWVLAGHRSKSGHPLLANDPHVAFSNPSVWYEAHLKTPTHEIYGHYVPLSPFPAMGHDRNRAWAVTMAEVDDLDIYIEKIDEEKKKVMYKGEWVPLKEYPQTIKVRKGKDVNINVRVTPHGPLLDDSIYGVSGKHLAIKWSYHHPDNNVSTAFYRLARTKNMHEMQDALKYGATPGLNVSWVDKKGNIGWHVMSKIPLRPKGVMGHQLLEGWSGKHEYIRYLEIEENPHKYNPESGVIVTANYFPEFQSEHQMSGYWQPSERFERISDLLKQKEKWSVEELKKVQNDQFVVTAKESVPILTNAVKKTQGELEENVLHLLKEWDGGSTAESQGTTIWHTWSMNVIKHALLDELGNERFKAINRIADSWHFYKTFLKNPNSVWWDDTTTENKETRDEIIERAFHETVAELKEQYKSNVVSDWKWGKIHTVEFEHIIGRKKPFNHFFNLGPYPAGGGFFQVDNMSSKRNQNGFKVTLGPSTRRLIDYAKPELSWGILPTGNSGQPASPHYRDQVKLFLTGKYRPQYLNESDIVKEEHSIMTLTPGKASL